MREGGKEKAVNCQVDSKSLGTLSFKGTPAKSTCDYSVVTRTTNGVN